MFVAMDLFIFCQVEDYTHKIVLSGSMYLNNFLIFHQDNIEKKKLKNFCNTILLLKIKLRVENTISTLDKFCTKKFINICQKLLLSTSMACAVQICTLLKQKKIQIISGILCFLMNFFNRQQQQVHVQFFIR